MTITVAQRSATNPRGLSMHTPWLYRLSRALAQIAVRIYFRKVEISGAEHMPRSGSVILAANHPQSVTDAIVLGTSITRTLNILAHSGMFNNRLRGWFLRMAGVIPVYRHEVTDAAERNLSMFAACHERLAQGGSILIFPEGTSAMEQRVQPLKTGAARIALEGEAGRAWSLGLQIVPVGLNFESRKRFRSRVLLRFGQPIQVSMFRQLYAQDPIQAVNVLTADLQAAISSNVINIEREEFIQLVAALEGVYKDELLARAGISVPGDSRFKRDQWIAREIPRALDHLLRHNPELIWRVRRLLREYLRKLERLRLKDEFLRQSRGRSIPGAATRFVFWGALGLPLAIHGTVFNYLPYAFTGWLADRLAPDETKIHYYRLVYGAAIYLVYYGTLLYLVSRRFDALGVAAFGLSLLPAGLFARGYARRMALRRERIRLGFLELNHAYYLQELRRLRRRLIRELDAGAAEYLKASRGNEARGREAETGMDT